MSNRCQSCEKFVSLENGEPEIQSLEVEWCDDHFAIQLDLRAVRNCAECGDEMKEYFTSLEEDLFLDAFDLPEGVAEKVAPRFQDGTLEHDWEEGYTSQDESGGARYKRNLISMVAEVVVSFVFEGKTYKSSIELKDQAPACAFEYLY